MCSIYGLIAESSGVIRVNSYLLQEKNLQSNFKVIFLANLYAILFLNNMFFTQFY